MSTANTSPDADTSSPLEIALMYIEHGLNITPVASPRTKSRGAGKAPCLNGWQNRKLTCEEFKREYRKGSNIGVITGASSGLICVDIDEKDGGMGWYYEHKDDLGDYVLETRGDFKSVHLYFRHPGYPVKSRLRLFPGVDILADGGKQVVTWPSLHPSNLEMYKIHNGLTLLDVASEADILPQWIIAELNRPEPELPSAPENLPVDDPTEIQNCVEALNRYPSAIEGQGGDNRTFVAAKICRDYALSPQKALEVLLQHYNPRCVPPWKVEDLRVKVASAYSKNAKIPPGTKTAAAIFSDPVPEVEEMPTPPPTYSLKLAVVSANTYLARNPAMTLCASDQLYRYSHTDQCWQVIKDKQFDSVIMADVKTANVATHNSLGMNFVPQVRTAIKRILEGQDPDRELTVDSWLTGETGEFIACDNGILNILTGEVLPHSPRWFSFTTLPFNYDPTAQCPVFLRFLDSIWDTDEELKLSLQRWIGYILISTTKYQKFAVFNGASRGGKGTIVRVVEQLVGARNFAANSMNTFGGEFGLEPLMGKRLAIFNDAEQSFGEKGHIATERIKCITGNDSVPVNRKNSSILTMALPAKIMLVCNKVPKFCNDQGAMTNRMIGFPFEKTFIGREDEDLKYKLHNELPGIFNWALKAARDILNGAPLIHSKAGKEMVDKIAEENDPIRCFIRDRLTITGMEHNQVTSNQLWEEYVAWCNETGSNKKNQNSFYVSLGILLKGKAPKMQGDLKGYKGIVIGASDTSDLDDPPF